MQLKRPTALEQLRQSRPMADARELERLDIEAVARDSGRSFKEIADTA
jgi:hypothetical protein